MMKKPFLQEILKELREAKTANINIKEILLLIEDIFQFFDENNIKDYEMS